MPRISGTAKIALNEAFDWWIALADKGEFSSILLAAGWQYVSTVSWKCCVSRHGLPYVLKWDDTNDNLGHYRYHHTWGEWRRWRSASEAQRQYLAPILRFEKGLLCQQYVKPCIRCTYDSIPEWIRKAGRFVGTSHPWDHRHSPLAFFDYDSRSKEARGNHA